MTMPDLSRPGRLLFAAGLSALGALGLIFGDLAPGLQPPLELLGSGQVLAYVAGGLLLIAALGLFGSARPVRQAGLLIAFYWLFWILMGHLPKVRAELTDVVAWVSLSEVAGAGAVAWLLARSMDGEPREGLRWLARIIVGLMLVWFGAVHLMYPGAIAGMIPDWMPGREVWPYLTGAATIAAGLAVVTGLLGRLGAALAGAMFASWIFLVHIPRLLAAPDSREEWTALALNFVLVGVVWIIQGAGFRRAA